MLSRCAGWDSRKSGQEGGVARPKTLGKLRQEGKDTLGDLEKPDACPVPNCRVARAVAVRPGTPDHLAAELDRSASSTKLHIADGAGFERCGVFNERPVALMFKAFRGPSQDRRTSTGSLG
jgi:hypothetical protein